MPGRDQKAIYQQHLDGINRSRVSRREGIGAATVERYFRHGLEEIAAMWRFSRNNGITEGFHNKMELISRQAYGFSFQASQALW